MSSILRRPMNFGDMLSELRRRRVLRVLAAYLVAGFVVLQVADLVVDPLGLPPWAMTLVLVLVALGLPVAAALAWAFDVTPEGVRRTSAAPAPTPADPATPAPHASNARRWAAVGVLGLLVAVVWPGWLALRRADAPPLDDGLVAVLPARVAGADAAVAYLREGMVDLVGAKLGDEVGLRAVDSRTLMRAWSDAAGAEGDLAPDPAAALARRLGAGRAMLTEVVGPAHRLTISATLVSTTTGDELGREQVVGPIDSLATLADEMLARMLAADAGEARHRLPALTRSLPALEAYLRGRVHDRAGRHGEAVRAYHEALQLDSTFALAALAFHDAGGWTTELRSFSETAARLAWTYRDRLSARDREYLEARLGPGYPENDGTFAEWVARAERALRLAPDRPELWQWYGDVLVHYGGRSGTPDALDRAREAFRRALELDPRYAGPAEHLADLMAAAGDSAQLRQVARDYLSQLHPDERDGEVALEIRWLLHLALGDPAPAPPESLGLTIEDDPTVNTLYYKVLLAGLDPRPVRRAMERFDAGPGTAGPSFDSHRFALGLLEGRPADSRRVIEEREARGETAAVYRTMLLLDRVLDHRPDEAARIAAALEADLARPAPDDLTPLRRLPTRYALALWEVLADERSMGAPSSSAAAAVARIAALADSLPDHRRRLGLACVAVVEAVAEMAAGGPGAATAVARAEAAVRDAPLGSTYLSPSMNLLLADMHEQLGDRRGALAAVRRAEIPYAHPMSLKVKLRQEGRLAALVGERDSAIAAYRRYLALRPEPEPAEAESDRAVRAELERLLSEG